MTLKRPSRRALLAGVATLAGAGALAGKAAALARTPYASEGPFYPRPRMRMADVDNDLVKVAGAVSEAGGEIFILKGTIRDRFGAPLEGRRIEIWQCDLNGVYLHPRDRRRKTYDAGFQGFGHDISDAEGRYSFRTIKPAVYPGRAPHIHVKVWDGRNVALTTQFYLDGHPLNDDDFLFNEMSEEDAATVAMAFTAGPDGPEATVDVVL